MIQPCCSSGFDGVVVAFSYDTDTLEVVQCERTGESSITVRARVRRDDGSAEWYADMSAPAISDVVGISFASAELDGLTFDFTVV